MNWGRAGWPRQWSDASQPSEALLGGDSNTIKVRAWFILMVCWWKRLMESVSKISPTRNLPMPISGRRLRNARHESCIDVCPIPLVPLRPTKRL